MTYILFDNGILEKDGFEIPINEFNSDYLDYLDWLTAGNEPVYKPAVDWQNKQTENTQFKNQFRDDYLNALDTLAQIRERPDHDQRSNSPGHSVPG